MFPGGIAPLDGGAAPTTAPPLPPPRGASSGGGNGEEVGAELLLSRLLDPLIELRAKQHARPSPLLCAPLEGNVLLEKGLFGILV